MKGKCIYPRRMINVMREFLLQASDLTFLDAIFTGKESDINEFFNSDNWQEKEYNCQISFKKEDGFCAFVWRWENENEQELKIGYPADILKSPYYRNEATKDIRQRFPFVQGFAGVTIALLHELGHFETIEKYHIDFADFDEISYEKESQRLKNDVFSGKMTRWDWHQRHFKKPNEILATEWAVDWLKNPEHRKIAKAFEKKFFDCFEKTS